MKLLTSWLILGLVRFYQLGVSPFTPVSCRYLPTCSEYALDAVKIHGPWRGCYLAVVRLARCHPWGGDGYDPVPHPTIKR